MVGLSVPPLLLLPAILVALPFQVLARAGHLMRREGQEAEGGGSMSVAPDGKVAEVVIPEGEVSEASKNESYMQSSSGGVDAAEVSPHGAPDGADLLRQPPPPVVPGEAGKGDKDMAKLHPCPMVSALIANGKVVLGPAGEWSSGQAFSILTDYFTAAGWPPEYQVDIKNMLVAGFFGIEALSGSVSVKVPEWRKDLKHTIYTGIRLPQIKDDPDFFQGACNAHAFMRDDPDCGKPGPHPVVFDELAKRLGKSDPEAKWGKEDTTKLCSTAEHLFFDIPAHGGKPMAYRRGDEHKAACVAVYGVLPAILGEMTTTELKALLTEDQFPAAFADRVNNFRMVDYHP